MRDVRIGILSFQGDFEKHKSVIEELGARTSYVRAPEEMTSIDGLILPGGESTTIGKLMARFGLLDLIGDRARNGMPILGTCAGAILLAAEIEESSQERIGLIPMTVRRNAYGRQIESFEADLDARQLRCGSPGANDGSGETTRGVFIRAPLIVSTGESCETLVSYEEHPVVVRYGRLIAATFHPELSGESRIHRCFLEEVAASSGVGAA